MAEKSVVPGGLVEDDLQALLPSQIERSFGHGLRRPLHRSSIWQNEPNFNFS
jgi:hypothetical protein